MPLAASTFDSLFTMPMPVGEKVARTVLVYFIVVVLLRVMGRHTVAQLNAFDLVVLLLISNVVQNAIIGPDDSVLGGVIGVVTLLVVNALIVREARRHRRLDRIIEGKTVTLVHDGPAASGGEDRRADGGGGAPGVVRVTARPAAT
jgi:uncharacterized membrane protein YcaP (DUF421 family)